MYSRSKEKNKNTPINFNTNYRREMKIIPTDMNCLLQFNALKVFLEVHLYEGLLPNFIFFYLTPQIA